MKKYLIVGLSILLIFIIFITSNVVDNSDLLGYRIFGGFLTLFGVYFIWIIMTIILTKSEPMVKKENMSLRYDDLSNKQLKKYSIDSESFKEMAFDKFKGILLAISNCDKDYLRDNLSIDLYHYYADEMDKFKENNKVNVIKDIELKNIKIYDITDEYNVLSVNIYMNVIMFDYIADKDSMECIEYNSDVKREYEFEVTFVKNKITDSEFVMSKKTCINDMDIVKEDK